MSNGYIVGYGQLLGNNKKMITLMEKFGLNGTIEEQIKKVSEQAEEICIWMHAKYNCIPEDVIQVMVNCNCGGMATKFVPNEKYSENIGYKKGHVDGYAKAMQEIKQKIYQE